MVPVCCGKGYGEAIANALERVAADRGATQFYLLSQAAAPFFEHLGYVGADRSSAPADIAASTEFDGLCPASARYLTKSVRTSR
jgi:N-acetylglutamate synthase-like GNAT family acetyltransferase